MKPKAKNIRIIFNGFYLPHELGHAFEYILHGDIKNSYESEYQANTIGFLWWKNNIAMPN